MHQSVKPLLVLTEPVRFGKPSYAEVCPYMRSPPWVMERSGDAGEGVLEGEDAEKQADQTAEQDPSVNPHPFGLPLSLVKRVMCMDSEVARISREGLQAVAKAAELLVADMAARSLLAAQGQKRRTIKLCDVSQTGEHVWLPEDFSSQ